MVFESTTGKSSDDGAGGPSAETTGTGSLRRVRLVAHLMDDAFAIPGTGLSFGLDPILGMIPGAGSAVAGLFSLYVLLEAAVAGVPLLTWLRMLLVATVDLFVGAVPLVGPLLDAAWKANAWNVAALERHVEGTRGS